MKMWHEDTVEHEGVTYWYQAKIYDTGSDYGINSGRISKLSICLGNKWNYEAELFNYDRGLDFDRLPAGVLEKVLNIYE